MKLKLLIVWNAAKPTRTDGVPVLAREADL